MFYEHLPLYDISSLNHKLIKKHKEPNGTLHGDNPVRDEFKYESPLPTSVIKHSKPCTAGLDHPYGDTNGGEKVVMNHHFRHQQYISKAKEENTKHRNQQQ